jgi:hypothetical protein
MNGTTSRNGQNGYKETPSNSQPKWREATTCNIDFNPCDPKEPTPKPCENKTKETYFFMNTEKSSNQHSGGLSKLAQLLLGLATLLALGSLLSNLFLVWAISKTTNTKEVTTTTTTNTKEIIREAADENYYYAPAARW